MRPLRGAEYVVKVYSIIVCYRPDLPVLGQICDNLMQDGAHVILVDNTEVPYLLDQTRSAECQLITLGRNTGIAHAQNVGVTSAIAAGADAIAFFDQDSGIEPGFLSALVSSLRPGTADIVSPSYFDNMNGAELPSVSVNSYGMPNAILRGDCSKPYPVDIVISSGTVATKEAFEVVGLFDEDFFIDFVDTEWCFRCRRKLIPIRIVPSAVMLHRIGNNSIKLGPFTVLSHSPIRCYYQLRNCFHLFRKTHIPSLFALRETISVFFSRALLLLLVDDKFTYLKAYLCAVRDGFKGVTGGKLG